MDLGEIRRHSTELLGNMYRLEIIEAVVRAGGLGVTATTIHDDTGIRYPRVQEELKRLTVAGVLRIVEHPGSQAVEYKAEPSVYWDLGHELLKELRAARSAPG